MAERSGASTLVKALSKYGDLLVVVGVVFVVIMMIIPMPAFLLDLLLAFNISISL